MGKLPHPKTQSQKIKAKLLNQCREGQEENWGGARPAGCKGGSRGGKCHKWTKICCTEMWGQAGSEHTKNENPQKKNHNEEEKRD